MRETTKLSTLNKVVDVHNYCHPCKNFEELKHTHEHTHAHIHTQTHTHRHTHRNLFMFGIKYPENFMVHVLL